MRKAFLGALIALALSVPSAPGADLDDPESCFAMNPAQPKCSFTITSESVSGTVTGAVGQGAWKVLVKRGKQKLYIAPSSTEPEPVAFQYKVGDKVTATTTSAGSWVLAGHD